MLKYLVVAVLFPFLYTFLSLYKVWLTYLHHPAHIQFSGKTFYNDNFKVIEDAVHTNDFSQVQEIFDNTWYYENSAVVIGTHDWSMFEASRGFVGLDTELVVASASKMFSSAVIHRTLATKLKGKLALDSLVRDTITSFPTFSDATLADLLGFVTGFDAYSNEFSLPYGANCGRAPPELSGSWEECVVEMSEKLSDRYQPGESFRYGEHHLTLAAAMVLKALGQPLTTESWEQLCYDMMFVPAGITDSRPKFPGIRDDLAYVQPMIVHQMWPHGRSDLPKFLPLSFGPFVKGARFPDIGGGLKISARNFGKVLSFMLSDDFLPEDALEEYIRPRTNDVQHWLWNNAGPRGGIDAWGYSQGSWVHCNAMEQFRKDRNVSKTELLTDQMYAEAKKVCGDDPQPRVRSSIGYYAAQPIVDYTNGYYVFFMHSWGAERKYHSYIAFLISFFICWYIYRLMDSAERRMGKKKAE